MGSYPWVGHEKQLIAWISRNFAGFREITGFHKIPWNSVESQDSAEWFPPEQKLRFAQRSAKNGVAVQTRADSDGLGSRRSGDAAAGALSSEPPSGPQLRGPCRTRPSESFLQGSLVAGAGGARFWPIWNMCPYVSRWRGAAADWGDASGPSGICAQCVAHFAPGTRSAHSSSKNAPRADSRAGMEPARFMRFRGASRRDCRGFPKKAGFRR